MRIITICSNRGGTGKTLFSLGLALKLLESGRNVLISDINFVNRDSRDMMLGFFSAQSRFIERDNLYLIDFNGPKLGILEQIKEGELISGPREFFGLVSVARNIAAKNDISYIIYDTNYSIFNLLPPPQDVRFTVEFLMLWGLFSTLRQFPVKANEIDKSGVPIYHIIPYDRYYLTAFERTQLFLSLSRAIDIPHGGKIRRRLRKKEDEFISLSDLNRCLFEKYFAALDNMLINPYSREIAESFYSITADFLDEWAPRNFFVVTKIYRNLLNIIPRSISGDISYEEFRKRMKPFIEDIVESLYRRMKLEREVL